MCLCINFILPLFKLLQPVSHLVQVVEVRNVELVSYLPSLFLNYSFKVEFSLLPISDLTLEELLETLDMR